MKVLRTSTTVLRDSTGRVLKIRPDEYVEPIPNVGMIQIQVEDNETVTLPTPDLASTAMKWAYIDLYMELYDNPLNEPLQVDDNSGSNSQPRIIRTLLANTEYYIKIKGANADIIGQYCINITGGSTPYATPTEEEGYISLTVATLKKGQWLDYGGEVWYKFKTTSAASYTIITSQGMLAEEYNYQVDWNDESTSPTITTWNSPDATHVYAHKGTYTIYITGTMPAWSVSRQAAGTGNIRLLVTKVISWGEIGLKIIDFKNCTALAALPEQTAKLTQVLTFTDFCSGCTSLVGIPYGTFFGNESMPILRAVSFQSAFYNCQSIRTIHQTTFRDCGNSNSFTSTFTNCIRLEFLPDLLFENCYRVRSWNGCFVSCNLITYIPQNFFYRAMMDIDYSLIAISDMGHCFSSCILLEIVPDELFSSQNIDNTGLNKIKGSAFNAIFAVCAKLNNLPAYLFHNQIYATSFDTAFYNCTSLTYTPVGCFEGCIAATNMGMYYGNYKAGLSYSYSAYGMFGNCSNLIEIRENCFKECYAVTRYDYLFNGCYKLTTLCDNIFDDSTLVLDFTSSFSTCRLLSSWNSDPDPANYQLDPEIFKYNTKVTTFQSTFSGCYLLKDIPEILFSTCIDVVNFAGTFVNCTGITAIPPKLFRYNSKVITFQTTFQGCTSITKIPIITEESVDYGMFYFNPLVITFAMTFYNCRLADDGEIKAIPAITFLGNTEVATNYTSSITNGSFYGTFQNNSTLQSIPDELFINCTKATDFSLTFAGCANAALTSVPANLFVGNQNADRFTSTFQGVPLESVPANLFINCVRVSTFSSCFSSTKLTTVPALLFSYAGGSVQNFDYTFQSCTLFDNIPIDLFRYNVNVQSFAYCFNSCTSLISVPQDIFRYNIIAANFTSTFSGCSKLIDPGTNIFRYSVGGINFTSVFQNCTKLELEPYMFYALGEESTRFLNKAMTFTNAFNRSSYNMLNLYMSYYLTKAGSSQANDDNAGGYLQPLLTRTLLANTTYYIKITVTGSTDSGLYDIFLTGGSGPGVPEEEVDCTLLYAGTPIIGESISSGQEKWYKFKTTDAGTYVFGTTLNATEILARQSTAPDLWNCIYNFTPTITSCFAGIGNNIYSLTNYCDIPSDWGATPCSTTTTTTTTL